MPIYEYRCGSCGHTLDALQKVSDPPLADCPDCEAPALKRLISAPSFRLKGSGWYETDFKSDKERRRNLAETGGKEAGDKSDKSDKPEKADKSEAAKADKAPGAAADKPKKEAAKAESKPAAKRGGSGSEAA